MDHDLADIKIYRYRETKLNVHVETPDKTATRQVRIEAHYVREQAVRDAGAILLSGKVPFLKPEGRDGEISYSVLPGEELEVSASAPGMKTAVARVQLKDGETRALRLALTAGE